MRVKKLHFTKHTYERIVERSIFQFSWSRKKYSITGFKGFLFLFLDELFKKTNIKKIEDFAENNRYIAKLHLYDAELIAPIVRINEDTVYIPTVLTNIKEKGLKDEKIVWVYPVILIPERPNLYLPYRSSKKWIYINEDQFYDALKTYAKKKETHKD